MSKGLTSILWIVLAAAATPAAAQSCPTEDAACDNGGCCLSAEQCCPALEDGCCSSSTPYCCGDGTCAATPSQCPLAGRVVCDGYDVPCGLGCAPAGSDCCDLVGHYCPPESMCTSDTTCVLGDMPTLAQLTASSLPSESEATASVSPPFRDPEDATDRSCSIAAAPLARRANGWFWLLATALWLRRRLPRIDR
jgi:hypothetical protein